MTSVQVAMLVLAALLVGAVVPVMLQLWLTLRQLQEDLRAAQAKIDPLIDDVRTMVHQVRKSTMVAGAVGAALAAGLQAWQAANRTTHEGPQDSPTKETSA